MIGYNTRRKAQAMAELPIVLWVIIVFLTIPLVDLTTFSLRYNFIMAASRDAAYSASRAKTFLTNVSSTELSAVNSATAAAQQTANAFSEVTINSVTTNIVITNLANGTVTRQSTKLLVPADTSTNAYQIETIVNGTISPLITMDPNGNYFVPIPGLTAPIPVSVASRGFMENPQGLNQ